MLPLWNGGLFFLLFFFPSGKLCLGSPYRLPSHPWFWLSPHCSLSFLIAAISVKFNASLVSCAPSRSALNSHRVCYQPHWWAWGQRWGARWTVGSQHPSHLRGTACPTCLTAGRAGAGGDACYPADLLTATETQAERTDIAAQGCSDSNCAELELQRASHWTRSASAWERLGAFPAERVFALSRRTGLLLRCVFPRKPACCG